MSRSRLAGRALTASITATGLLLGSSAGSALAQDDDVTTLRVTTKNIEVTVVDLGPPGKSSGDLYVYTGTVHRNGKRIGRIHGSNTSIRVKGRRETVSGQLTMQLGNGNQIVAGGLSAYPSDDNMRVHRRQAVHARHARRHRALRGRSRHTHHNPPAERQLQAGLPPARLAARQHRPGHVTQPLLHARSSSPRRARPPSGWHGKQQRGLHVRPLALAGESASRRGRGAAPGTSGPPRVVPMLRSSGR